MTSGRLLARNTVINFAGQAAPLLVALFAIPLLIDGLGTDRFGVLNLAWIVVAYFSLFDLGLSRSLTKLVAEKLGVVPEEEISALIWNALLLILLLGLAGALILGLLSPWLVRDILNLPQALQPETLRSFYLLALCVPVVISTAGLRGILEARQRFDLINAVAIPLGAFTYLGPLLVLPFSTSLFPVVAVLVIARVVAWLVHLLLCLRVMPALRHSVSLQRSAMGPLLRFGSWITVSNVVGPLMLYLDRFLVGALISMAAVAYYATPYTMVTKLLLVASALAGVLFPAFATSFAQDRDRTARLFSQGVRYTFLTLFPVVLIIVTLAHEGLNLWLGPEFAQNSTTVLQWLTVGVFINSLAHIPFALIQSVGRPDITAKLHLVELPFYLFILWWLLSSFGIEGAAVAWVVRVTVDAVFLFGATQQFLPTSAPNIWRVVFVAGGALLVLAVATLPVSIIMKGLFLLLALLVFGLVTWLLILAPEERASVQKRLKITHVFD